MPVQLLFCNQSNRFPSRLQLLFIENDTAFLRPPQVLHTEMRSLWGFYRCRRATGWRSWRDAGGREDSVPKRRTTEPKVSVMALLFGLLMIDFLSNDRLHWHDNSKTVQQFSTIRGSTVQHRTDEVWLAKSRHWPAERQLVQAHSNGIRPWIHLGVVAKTGFYNFCTHHLIHISHNHCKRSGCKTVNTFFCHKPNEMTSLSGFNPFGPVSLVKELEDYFIYPTHWCHCVIQYSLLLHISTVYLQVSSVILTVWTCEVTKIEESAVAY